MVVLGILLIAFVIAIMVIAYEITTIKNCGNCKHRHSCWTKVDAQTYQHSCEHHEKAEEIV